MTLHAQFEPLPDLPTLGARWRALEERADASFFLGWTWIGSWLEASGARPELLTVRDDGHDVALALVGRGRVRRKFGSVPALFLNQAGAIDADRPFIEYNGLLAVRGAEAGACQAAADAFAAHKNWKMLRLAGVEPDCPLVQQIPARRRVLVDLSPAYFVDLDAVRAIGGDYLSLLSANSRSQIRRSLKEHGEPVIEPATDPAQTGEWVEDMRALNAGRHTDNAWDHEGFRRFARVITEWGLVSGEVELLRICCGGKRIGYLHNFRYRDRAMNYQSAFVEAAGPKSKPGLMCHVAAVQHHGAQGLSRYSLLAGKDRYKASLATGQDALQWWTLERFAPVLEIEALARRLLRR